MKAVNSDTLRQWLAANEIEVQQPPVPAPGRLVLSWPAPAPVVVTQPYGVNKQWYQQFGLPGHEGIDIRAVNGAPITACADGIVSRVQAVVDGGAYGIHVRIKHEPAPSDIYETVYAHFLQTMVAVGQQVTRGQTIGKADNTGNSSGAHLHLTLKHYGHGSPWMNMSDMVNPTPYMADLFPGNGWRVDVPGNLRRDPLVTGGLIRLLAADTVLDALDFGGQGGDWWKVRVRAIGNEGWFWNPGYKLRAL